VSQSLSVISRGLPANIFLSQRSATLALHRGRPLLNLGFIVVSAAHKISNKWNS
jgi:hypothetical protein